MLFLWFIWRYNKYRAALYHGFMSFIFMCLIYMLPEDSFRLAQISLINSFVYFINDMTLCDSWSNGLHHLVSAASCYFGLYFAAPVTITVAKICGILESSNPLWTLLRIRLDCSDELWLPARLTKTVIGSMFIVQFFIVRFIVLPLFMYYQLPAEMPTYICYPLYTVFQMINVYWLYRLIVESIRLLRRRT